MRVLSVPLSVPFLRCVIAALIDGRLVEGFEARSHPARLAASHALSADPARHARRARSVSGRTEQRRRGAAAHRGARRHRRGRAGLRRRGRAALGSTAPLDIPLKLGELERQLTLARLVAAWAKGEVLAPLVVGGPAATLALAGDLARLMDDMVTRGVSWERARRPRARPARRILEAFAAIPADRARGLAELSRRDRQDRAGGAARPPDRGGSRAADRASPGTGDRRGLDRFDADHREIPAGGGEAAAGRGDPARPRHRSRRRSVARHRRRARRQRASSRSIPHRTIRNLPCMRCSIASASSAATSRFCNRRRRAGRDVLLSEAMRPVERDRAMA